MTKEQLRTTYRERTEQFEAAIRKQTGIINLLSLGRLLALIGTIWLVVAGIKNQGLLFYLLALALAITFLFLVTKHNRHRGERDLLRQLKLLNEKELSCLDHDFHDLPDGSEHADASHPWSHDLDLFGQGSLFQYLNRTSTLEGKRILAEMLTTEPASADTIMERQRILDDLKERLDFRQQFIATGHLVKEKPDDLENISNWLNSKPYISKYPWLFYAALGMSLLSLAIITWGLFDASQFKLLLFVLMINFSLLSPFLMRTQQYQSVISKKHDLLLGYTRLLRLMAGTIFSHADLQKGGKRAHRGTREVAKLSKLLQIFDQRLNMLLGFILNALFLFDFILLHLLERWKRKNQQEILDWIELSGWSDAMVSLAGFAWNHPDFSNPIIGETRDSLIFKGLGHPLIPDSKRVNNDIGIDSEKVVVVTGANMAGKSTYLRSLGINMVLAYTGCPVCATQFSCGFMGLHSSMRTADSLKDEESYFLAEIKKLQQIVVEMESGKPMLILLDEVLKGTNTTDKKLGSIGLIQKAIKYPVRCFIATHDLSLGELEKEHKGAVVNYCFESYIKDMELSFDYTIRKGIATNMNASFLMKKMGIVD